jgi:hypothetical protein
LIGEIMECQGDSPFKKRRSYFFYFRQMRFNKIQNI